MEGGVGEHADIGAYIYNDVPWLQVRADEVDRLPLVALAEIHEVGGGATRTRKLEVHPEGTLRERLATDPFA